MRRIGALSLLLALAALALAGCGGGEGSTTRASTARTAPTGPATQEKSAKEEVERKSPSTSKAANAGPPASAFHPKPHQDSGGGSEQFRVAGGDNSVQDYGSEASEAELEAAAASLHGFLDARAEGNWPAACGYLAREARQGLVKLVSEAAKREDLGCPAVLASLSEGLPKANLREAAIADVGSLRVEGDHAFLIYRGAKGFVYGISIRKEGNEWKLETLGGTPIAN